MKTTVDMFDADKGDRRTVELGERVYPRTGPAAARGDTQGEIITRCREAVRLRFEDGEVLLAFGVEATPAQGFEYAIAA
jgi:hypothetical protein